jgi:hypothetical protein
MDLPVVGASQDEPSPRTKPTIMSRDAVSVDVNPRSLGVMLAVVKSVKAPALMVLIVRLAAVWDCST